MTASFTHGDFTRVRQTTMILRVYSKGLVLYTLWLFNIAMENGHFIDDS